MSRSSFLRISILHCLLAFALIFSGCGWLSLTQKTRFIPATEDVELSISTSQDGPFELISDHNQKLHLNHYKKNYFIRQEKEGFLSQTSQISRTSRNHLKRVDIGMMIGLDVAATFMGAAKAMSFTGSLANPYPDALVYTMLGVGLAGWGAIIPEPGRLFPRKVELPKLVPIIKWKSSQLQIATGDFDHDLTKKKIVVRDFATMDKMKRGYDPVSRDSADAFPNENDIKLKTEVTASLKELEYYVDTLSASRETTLRVGALSKAITFNVAENKINCQLKTVWSLQSYDRLQYLYGGTMNSESDFLAFDEKTLSTEEQKTIVQKAYSEALTNSLVQFIGMDTVQSILNAPAPIPLREELELSLTTGSSFASSVPEAVSSVITVVSKDGHGSGCVITEDGYVVTNAHVVDTDTVGLYALFSENVSHKIPLKFVRMNEAVDLALLKLDTTGLKPFRLGTFDDIETGADVYAIGTPADVELGQTVTRGIISGKRKFGGHSLIQTDVGISPGNSGGALIRPDGLLLGIVTAEMKSHKVDDIGFAVPAHLIGSSLKIDLQE